VPRFDEALRPRELVPASLLIPLMPLMSPVPFVPPLDPVPLDPFEPLLPFICPLAELEREVRPRVRRPDCVLFPFVPCVDVALDDDC
jgi:hypothetical protein